MAKNLHGAEPLSRVAAQQPRQEAPHDRLQELRQFVLDATHARGVDKRQRPHDKLVEEHPQGPTVGAGAVVVPFNDLGRHV